MNDGHDKHTEWVSIGDFMAGIVGVLIMFFVVAVLISTAAKIDAQKKKESGVRKVMTEVSDSVGKDSGKGIQVLVDKGTIMLTDSLFRKGSACLDSSVRSQLSEVVGPVVKRAMLSDKALSLQIEGHSDTSPVSRGSSNLELACAPFDDNYTLSAGRAREARNALLAGLDAPGLNQRISVVGYGPDRLLNPNDPESSQNRRVELRFVIISE